MLNQTLEYFKELSKIPRCSKNEQNAILWCKSWAEKNNYIYKIDKIWNILIEVPATAGMENRETVVLQWHIDMVCVKSKDSKHDFEVDEISIIEKDGWLYADNTTLWADDGIWVAIAMAATSLEKHPRIEILVTIDEEKGMSWVANLEEWFISGTSLINIDSEDEWEITMGSAGWSRVSISWEYKTSLSEINNYKFVFSGIKWGHSWVEIHKSLWNAVDAFFSFLDYSELDFWLSFVKSWIAENVIPKELEAVINLDDISELDKKIWQFVKMYKKEFKEPDFSISYQKLNESVEIVSELDSYRLKEAVLRSNSWVYKMSEEIKDFVITSQNLWVFNLEVWKLDIKYLCRSSVESELESLVELNKRVYFQVWKVTLDSFTPGWLEDSNSPLIKTVKNSYEKITWENVNILWVHAGLECWAIINKMPENSKAVSIWPNIYWAHTIEERCEIRSVWVLCEVLKDVLENI